MDRTTAARLLRLLIVGSGVAAVFTVLVGGFMPVLRLEQETVLVPFVAAALATAGLGLVLPRVDRWVQRLTHHRMSTPYSALAAAADRIRAGSLHEALPGLAQVLADGTGAGRASVWLVVEDRVVRAATHPPDNGGAPVSEPNLAVLLARPDTDHVVPVLDGAVMRAVLTIGKAGGPITQADQQLMRDVANGAGSLLREVQLGAELEERVRRAADLAAELQRSRRRLGRARDVERRRLVAELAHATTEPLAALRGELERAAEGLAVPGTRSVAVRRALHRARSGLDELLERFRSIARGVYPAVLRDQGPVGALEELAADLPRPVRLEADLSPRLDWEIESGIYYVTASALQHLAGRPDAPELRVQLVHGGGRLSTTVEDPAPDVEPEDLRAALAIDTERLAALGGELELVCRDAGTVVRAWLPDRLEPLVDTSARHGEEPW